MNSAGASGPRASIVEVSTRDGLQNEPAFVSTRDKVALVDMLSGCGFERIEVTSFVSPTWVPQLADASEVMAGITRSSAVRYAALAPNIRGFENALKAGVDDIAIFMSASESFSRRNLNCSMDDSIERFVPVAAACRQREIPLRGYVSCAVECPYEGAVAASRVAHAARRLRDLGCYEISLGDTTGRGRPEAVASMLEAVLSDIDASMLAGHFHDTTGRALDNIEVALDHGLRVFDASVGGLGGCPYAPGAKGNVDTLAVDGFLKGRGFETGLASDRLAHAAAFARSLRSGDG